MSGGGDALADPAVLRRPRADARDALLMQLVVEERAVVGHDDQERDLVMRRGPDRGVAIMKSPSPQTATTKPARAFQRERGADRIAGAAADAAAAFRADIIERMAERPGRTVPGQRDVRERHVALADRKRSARTRSLTTSLSLDSSGMAICLPRARRQRLGGRAESLEQLGHRLVRRDRQQHVDRRQALIVHAPAAVDAEVVGDGDTLALIGVVRNGP